MKQKAQPQSRTFIAYVVTEKDGNSFWNRIGAAWSHKDNDGFTLALSALPANGRIVIRTRRENADGKEGAR